MNEYTRAARREAAEDIEVKVALSELDRIEAHRISRLTLISLIAQRINKEAHGTSRCIINR